MPQFNYTRQHALPLWARLSIERLQCEAGLRNEAQLNYLLDVYARINGEHVDVQMRNMVHAMCREQFKEMQR
jgi:hypothetical protein